MAGPGDTPRGIYREKDGWGTEDSARLTSGMDVPESRYRSQGYEPPFETLPTKQEYEARPT